MYEVIKNYQDNKELRNSFNMLAEKTYGLNFENWYKNGYWNNKYIPYSIKKDNEIIANVSVNIMNMHWEGAIRNFIQLGTVMTDKPYRNQGLIRRIMEEIELDFAEKVDGMYLFANDSVLDFYPKFGYRKAAEFQYSKAIEVLENSTIKQIPMQNKKDWKVLERAIQNSSYHTKLSTPYSQNILYH